MKKILYKHQQDILDANPPRHGIFFSTGTGKTLTAIELALLNKVNPLIIVPKALKYQWSIQVPAHWTIITKEEFRRDWDELPKWDAVIVDECFVAGTQILTENGYKNIENISIGEKVVNAVGVGVVEGLSIKETKNLLTIFLSNGRNLKVTEEHPFFTTKGWVKAKDLLNNELLHYNDIHNVMDRYGKKKMFVLPKRISSLQVQEENLWSILRSEITPLQVRHSPPRENDCYRSRWQFTRTHQQKKSRPQKNQFSSTIRVEDIQIQEQRGDAGTTVYNLKVSGHPSYVVEDVLVHNCHYFCNYKSQMSKAFLAYCKKHSVQYRWLLTATPFRSSPMDIYSLANHLGHKLDYWSFFNRFFTQIRMGHRMIPKIRAGMQKELAAIVRQIGSVAKLEDLVDMPPQVHEVEYFELNKEQTKAIKDLTDTNFISRFTKTHEIEQGFYKGNKYEEDAMYPSFKVDRILDLAEEHKKFAVFCRYNLQIDILKKKLEAAGKKVWVIRGDVKDRASVVREVDQADGVVLINAACSEGYELPSVRTFVFASLSWSFVNFVQACGRNNRINNLQRNLYITLVVKGGTDEDIFKAIESKKDFNIEIYEIYKK